MLFQVGLPGVLVFIDYRKRRRTSRGALSSKGLSESSLSSTSTSMCRVCWAIARRCVRSASRRRFEVARCRPISRKLCVRVSSCCRRSAMCPRSRSRSMCQSCRWSSKCWFPSANALRSRVFWVRKLASSVPGCCRLGDAGPSSVVLTCRSWLRLLPLRALLSGVIAALCPS